MDIILTNSINTKKRIKNFLWAESRVLYPPVDLKEFKYIWQQNYYLSFARISDAKRVDKIVEAFKQMPEEKIKIVYWENDPQREKVFELAKWCENIEFLTFKWNKWFKECVWNCTATIYIPIDEDFWMSSIESMAAWKPVLWVDDGGLKETIIHKETWFLIDKEAKIQDIIKAISFLNPKKSLEMRKKCENRARDFSLEKFEEELKIYVI